MKSKTLVAMLLIALGIAALAYGGRTSWSRSHPVPLPPLAGALAIGVGFILLNMSVKKPIPAGARS